MKNKLFTEKYRPEDWDNIICEHKEILKKYCEKPLEIPSFIFYGQQGTGKTSIAKIIANAVGADLLRINSSDQRDIETVRVKVKNFAESMNSEENTKRCVFMDESDGLLKASQEALKVIMEEYSANCFFIFSCNDYSKMIAPIAKGRTISLCFNSPNKEEILTRLRKICKEEDIKISSDDIEKLVKVNYPDIRSMVMALNRAKTEGTEELFSSKKFMEVVKAIEKKDVQFIYEKVYSGNFDLLNFNRFYFDYVFKHQAQYGLKKLAQVSNFLADTEKSWVVGANLEICFLNNILKIMKVEDK